ncbi:MAG TPA: hypothetical protein IAB23_12565 [Candidatus Scybalocola faecavium]|nr:hypothetical protein [Candidatus Scybalocola faecavium]
MKNKGSDFGATGQTLVWFSQKRKNNIIRKSPITPPRFGKTDYLAWLNLSKMDVLSMSDQYYNKVDGWDRSSI